MTRAITNCLAMKIIQVHVYSASLDNFINLEGFICILNNVNFIVSEEDIWKTLDLFIENRKYLTVCKQADINLGKSGFNTIENHSGKGR